MLSASVKCCDKITPFSTELLKIECEVHLNHSKLPWYTGINIFWTSSLVLNPGNYNLKTKTNFIMQYTKTELGLPAL
jgi:hypothetical protein